MDSDQQAERQRRRELKKAKALQAQDFAVIQSIMAYAPGRDWMRRKLEVACVFHQSFTGDALTTAFNEGRRSMGNMILAELMGACPEAYITMMKEANDAGSSNTWDKRDPDDERNWDAAGRWVGDGDGPEDNGAEGA